MPFHRLTSPTYAGGLPGTHDFINDPASNGDPGVPAPADGKKGVAIAPGDQNEGTYFVAFKEPADALAVNRPAQALSENTDFIDDIMHRDLAVPAFLDVASGHGGTLSVVLTGDVFVGDPGTPNNAGVRNQLVQFVDPVTGEPLAWSPAPSLPVVYTFANVSLIHDGSNVDQVGNSFFTNPTATLAASIPNALAFRVLYYVRGRLKDQPTKTYSRLEHHAVGLADILANLTALNLNAAARYNNNTFTGTQDFQGTMSFDDVVTLAKASATAAFLNDDNGLKRVLLFKLRVALTPNIYLRIYKIIDPAGGNRGLEFTYNASWASDSAPEWASDSTSTNFHPTRLRFQGAITSFANEGLFYQVLDNSTLGAGTWAETVWQSANVRSLAFSNGAFLSGEKRAAVPILATSFGVSSAPDDGAANPYKLLFQFPSGGTQNLRLYSGDDDTALGLGGAGHMVLVHNAVWNPFTELWSHDDNAQTALALFIRTSTNPVGINALGGSLVSGDKSQAASAIYILAKVPGAGTWAANAWDKTAGNAAHLRLAGEYGYAGTTGGKEMKQYINLIRCLPKPGSSWAFTDTGTTIEWSTSATANVLFAPLEYPYGAIINTVSVDVSSQAAGPGSRMFAELFELDNSTGLYTIKGTGTANGAGGNQTLTPLLVGSAFLVTANKSYFVRITHGLVAGAELVFRVHSTYTARINAPGPGDEVGLTYVP